MFTLQWRHNGRDGVSNLQCLECLFNRLFRCRSNKTPKLGVTGLCEGNTPVTGEFPSQMTSNAENVSIWWRHHEVRPRLRITRFYLFPDQCVCRLLGDPIINMFDGQVLMLSGVHKYTMAKCMVDPWDVCSFNVEIKAGYARALRQHRVRWGTTMLRFLDIETLGSHIRIGQNHEAMVCLGTSGARLTCPSGVGKYFKVINTGTHRNNFGEIIHRLQKLINEQLW